MTQRFRSLRTISTVFKILALAVGLIAFVVAIAICLAGVAGSAETSEPTGYGLVVRFGLIGGALGGLLFGAIVVVGGAGLAAALYAFGDLILLQIAIEENSRATLRLLEAQALRLQHEQTGQYPYYPGR
jgi:uncharacterized membrane protein